MGDPGSIGPEITVKALGNPSIYEKIRPLVIGDAWVMAEALKITGGGGRSCDSSCVFSGKMQV